MGGDPGVVRVAPSPPSTGWWPARKSERATVLMKPGNSGGGKSPCFWCACEGGNGAVIDESLSAAVVPNASRASCVERRRKIDPRCCRSAPSRDYFRGLCGEASRKAQCGKSACWV